jgi:uncharacterized protein
LALPRDEWNAAARRWAKRCKQHKYKLLTTQAVLMEVGAAFARTPLRQLAQAILQAAERDPALEVLAFDASLYERALTLFLAHPDKNWSMTDCASFVVMKERGLTHALSADHHFEQAGFVALLRN